MMLDIEELRALVNQQSREAAEDRRRYKEATKRHQEDAKRQREKADGLIAYFRQQRELLEGQQ